MISFLHCQTATMTRESRVAEVCNTRVIIVSSSSSSNLPCAFILIWSFGTI